jgi:multidrug resistance protein, MATE family
MTVTSHAKAQQSSIMQEPPAALTEQEPPAASTKRISKQREFKTLARLAAPIVLSMISQQGMVITDQVMVGQLVGTTDALAAASVSTTIFNLVWYVTIGASSALDTLGSQSWGAGDKEGLRKWACICLTLLTIMNIVGAIILSFSGPIAQHLLEQTPEVSALVSSFCRALIPGMFPLSWTLVLHQVLQIQGRTTAPMVIAVTAFFANLAANAGFIEAFGFAGAPIATTASRALMFVLTLAYAHWHSLVPGLSFFSRRELSTFGSMLQSRGPFLALAASGAAMMGLEAASFDVTTAFAAYLGEVEVSAHAALINVTAFTFFSFPYGISIASSIRVVSGM